MTSRRLIRIKVLQLLYAYSKKDRATLAEIERDLMQSMKKSTDLYYETLLLLTELRHKAFQKIDTARIERRPYQFLYKEGNDYVMMHTETYEQVNIPEELINAPQFLKEGDNVEMVVHADSETPLYVELMPSVVLEVTYTEPGLKGDTASSTALKPAEVETGAKVMVPLFVETGEKIRVSTADGSYVERVR